jgi:hypothetical protein
LYTGQGKPATNRSMAASMTPATCIVRSSVDVRTHIISIISRWDPQRGEIPNGHSRAPIDPVWLGFPNGSNQTVKHLADGKCEGVWMHPPFRCEAPTSPPGVRCPTSHEPDRRCGWVVVGCRGIVPDCRAAEIMRELDGLVGANPPCLGLMLRSDGAVLFSVCYVYSLDKQSGEIKRKGKHAPCDVA